MCVESAAYWDGPSDEAEQHNLTVRLMGTVEALLDNQLLDIPGRRVRLLLAVLALSAGRPVSMDRIATVLWDEDLPANVRASVQTYIGRLRRAIGTRMVARESGGYRLLISRCDVDLLHFADRVDQATRADVEVHEREQLAGAIRMWSDAPFGASANEWLQTHESSGWHELYLQAVERKADLDLAAGCFGECVVELQGITSRYPLRESLWARKLTALHRSGRTADALQQYEQLRTRIADELGVDPSAELRAIHAQILRSDATEPDSWLSASSVANTPRLLPPADRRFTGRYEQLKRLDAHLDNGSDLLALHGPAGAGKTSLAVHWAQNIADQFPDGQIFINLRGFGTTGQVGAMEALSILLRAMGVAGQHLPADQDRRETMWRDLASSRKMLIVLDNARDSAQVRPLLTHGGSSVVLVTSRSQLRSLTTRHAADRVLVGQMPEQDSMALLSAHSKSIDSRETLAELASLCGHLPLALAIAAERASRDEGTPIEEVVASLRGERLRVLSAGGDDPDTSVQAVLDWSYETLDHATARVLRMVGLAPAARFTRDVVAALVGIDNREAETVLSNLVDRHLVIEQPPGWYDVHDLTRDYAQDLTLRLDTTEQREQAIGRLRSWYIHSSAHAATGIGESHKIVKVHEPAPGIVPRHFDDPKAGFRWFLEYRQSIIALIDQAVVSRDHATVYTIIPMLGELIGHTGDLYQAIRLCELAFDAASQAGDQLAQANCATQLGGIYRRGHDYVKSIEWLSWARDLYAGMGQREGELHATLILGVVLLFADDLEGAAATFEKTRNGARELGADHREASALNNLSLVYGRLGRRDEAVAAAEECLAIHERLDEPFNKAGLLDTLGNAQLGQGDATQARESFLRALALHEELGESEGHVITMKNLGIAENALGHRSQAEQYWRDCLAMFDRLNAADSPEISREELRALLEEH